MSGRGSSINSNDELQGDGVEVEVPLMNIKAGEHVDIKALLSSKARDFLVSPKSGERVHVSSLEGKYLILSCFFSLIKNYSFEIITCQAIEPLYAQLSLQGIANSVCFVFVPKLDPGFNDIDFYTLLSKLSVDCLAVPSSDSKSCHYICDSLPHRPSLIVHPNGTVLQLNTIFLTHYGADSFPFNDQVSDSFHRQDEMIKLRLRSSDYPLTLKEILPCDSLSQIGDENKSIPVSDLDDTDAPVGLYLYYHGGYMDELLDIHKKVLDKGLKFEIVLVPLPFDRHYDDPAFFVGSIKQSALRGPTGSSWWTFPFDDKICRALWRLVGCLKRDRLIILPHGGGFGDLEGSHIASYYGIDAYPFTRYAMVESKVNYLRSLPLECLLGETSIPGINNNNVLLYFAYPTACYGNEYLWDNVIMDYPNIKAQYPGTEVYFVPLEPISSTDENDMLSEMSLPIFPPEKCDIVIKHIFMNQAYRDEYPHETLVAFGKDGKVLSRCAHKHLPLGSECTSLFDDTLRSEILKVMEEEMW